MLTPNVAAKVGVDFLNNIIETKALPNFGGQFNVNNFNDLDIPSAIYIATVANAGGGKDIRGTKTYANAKEVEKFFYILEEDIAQGTGETTSNTSNIDFSPLRKY